MKLHPPLHRDATDASIQSRDLSDPHAYSMTFPPPPHPEPRQESPPDLDDDELWPLRPRATTRSGYSRRRDYADFSSRRSSSQNHSVPSHHHSSSVSSSVTRVASRTPSAEKLAEFSDSTPTTSEERLSRKLENAGFDSQGKRNTQLQDMTALPTIPSKAGPVRTVFRAGEAWIRKLQEVPEQPCQYKPSDIEGEPVFVFTPGRGVYMAFTCLAILTIMVALDSTALSVALPVCYR